MVRIRQLAVAGLGAALLTIVSFAPAALAQPARISLEFPVQSVAPNIDVWIANQTGPGGKASPWNQGNSAFVSSGLVLNSGTYRPDPASFNPLLDNASNPDGQYVNSSGAPAAFGGRVRASIGPLSFDLGHFAIVDASVAWIQAIPLNPLNDQFDLTGWMNFDGLSVTGTQPVADSYFVDAFSATPPYFSVSSFTSPGTYTLPIKLAIGTPIIFSPLSVGEEEDLGLPSEIILEGTMTIKMVPEPSSLALVLPGAWGVTALVTGRRRARRRVARP